MIPDPAFTGPTPPATSPPDTSPPATSPPDTSPPGPTPPNTEARPSSAIDGPGDIAEPVAASIQAASALMQHPDAEQLGRFADSPVDIAWPGWRAVIRRTVAEMLTDRVALVAAGCAFYGTLALFPAISMLISVYGLAFDTQTVLPQLAVLQDLLPPAAFKIISERVTMLVSKPPGSLGWSLLASTAVTLWSSASGTKSVITALNLAYEEREARSFLRYQLVAFTITIAVIIGTAVGLSLLVALPPALDLFGFASHQRALIRAASFALLIGAVIAALSLLYRYAPSRETPRWQWVTPGSLLATALWVAASVLFSWYVATFATYDAMYGPLGTVVAIMMWFYVTAYAVLLGAELNAELELQTGRDSTDGPPLPLGHRGAYVADHVAAARRP